MSRGRKQVYEEKQDSLIVFKTTKQFKEELKKYSIENNIKSISDFIKKLIEEKLNG